MQKNCCISAKVNSTLSLFFRTEYIYQDSEMVTLQRWANSVLITEYEYEYYSAFQNDWIRIQILFGFSKWPNTNTNTIRIIKMTEYEYYSDYQKWLNTNTNTIRIFKSDRIRIRILFGLSKMTEYEYEHYSDFQKWPNTNLNI